MEIKAIAPWFGGKRNLAPTIVEELGEHRVYWEPFCGSMAVLLVKPPCVMETVNDLHGDLTNLARVIQDPEEGPRLYRRLRRMLVCEGLFREAVDHFSVSPCEDLDPDRAYWYFISSWLGRNGIAGSNMGAKRGPGHSFCVRFTARGGQPATRFSSCVKSIPAWRERLRKVTILSRDGFALIDRIEDAGNTAIYVDPPYLLETRTGYSATGGLSRYLHDFEPEHHQRLAERLARFTEARVVVSYYDHPQLALLYPGWVKRHLDVAKAMSHPGGRGSNETRAPEVLLINGPSFAAEQGRLF